MINITTGTCTYCRTATGSFSNVMFSFLPLLFNRPPTFGEWSDELNISVPELKKQIRVSQRAKAALIEANLRLVVTVARQTVKQGRSEINFQDCCQEGIIGLSIACDKFDPEKGKLLR